MASSDWALSLSLDDTDVSELALTNCGTISVAVECSSWCDCNCTIASSPLRPWFPPYRPRLVVWAPRDGVVSISNPPPDNVLGTGKGLMLPSSSSIGELWVEEDPCCSTSCEFALRFCRMALRIVLVAVPPLK